MKWLQCSPPPQDKSCGVSLIFIITICLGKKYNKERSHVTVKQDLSF